MNNLSYLPTHPKDNLYKFFSVTGILILLLSIIVPLLQERDLEIQTIQTQGEMDLLSAEMNDLDQDIARAQQDVNDGKMIDIEALRNRNTEQGLKIVELETKIKRLQRYNNEISQLRKISNFGIISGVFIFLVGFLLWRVKLHWLDGFAVPVPAQVTQTVGQQSIKNFSMKNSITTLIRDILRVQSAPPRQIKYMEVLRAVFKDKNMAFTFFFGLAIALPFFIVPSNLKPSVRIFFALFGLAPLLLAAVPFYYAHRLSNAIKIGQMLSVKVESVKLSQNLRNIENWFAQGVWRLPEGQLIDFIIIDQPWAKDIKVGSWVEVLVVSPKFNGIFPLGLHE